MLAMTKRNLLEDILNRKNWSIYRLSKETGISYQTMHALVRSDEIPEGTTYRTLRSIAHALGVKIDDLETEC